MNQTFLKIIIAIIILSVVSILSVDQFMLGGKTMSVSEYFEKLNNQFMDVAIATSSVSTFAECENFLPDYNTKFTCYTEKYRTVVDTLPTELVVERKTGYFEFPLCHNAQNELERQACYFEAVVKFKDFADKDAEGKANYGNIIAMCKNFQDEYYRLLCVRSISLKSVQKNEEPDLQEMCIKNTNTRAERIMCVVGFANKLAELLYPNKGVGYEKVYTDVCQVLPGNEPRFCAAIIQQSPEKTFYLVPLDAIF